jgi:hypothetical protein
MSQSKVNYGIRETALHSLVLAIDEESHPLFLFDCSPPLARSLSLQTFSFRAAYYSWIGIIRAQTTGLL